MNRLLLVDGTAYLFRAYYALPTLTTADGRPTGALHGVVNMIQRLLREEPPDLLAFVMDAPGPTFRDEIYPEYKANRDVMPEDLREQIEPVVNVVEAMGVPLLRVGGVEADDVIGTLASQAGEEGLDTLISTTDKDFAQLVGPHVRLVSWTSNRVIDSAAVEEKFGVPPERIRDYLALAGDASDNIPGVRGVGPKTAAKWLQAYGSLEGVKENAGEIRGKAGETLRASFADVDLSLQLATIRKDVPLDVTPHDLGLRAPDIGALEPLCATFELNTLLRSLRQTAPAAPKKAEYATVLNSEQLEECLAALRDAPAAGLSVEASGENPMELRLAGLAVSTGEGEGAYVPLAPRDLTEGAVERSDGRELLGRLKDWLEDAGARKVGHNLKFVSHALANHGIELAGGAGDTMLESYVLNSTAITHDFVKAAKRYLDLDCIAAEDVFGKGRGKLSPARAPLELVTPYAAQKADYALRLHRVLTGKLEETPVLGEVLGSMEMPLAPVLARMERAGVLVDAKVLSEHSQELAGQLQELQEQAFGQAGREFNLGSPKQLGDVLFNRLGLEPVRRTSTGQPSTSESVLQGTGGGAPPARNHPQIPQPGQAQDRLHRRPSGLYRPAHRAGAYLVPAGRGRHRKVVVHPPQPAEHPGAHRRGAAHTPGLRGAGGAGADLRRLLADRIAHHGPALRGRRSAESLLRGHGRAPRHRRRGVRRGARFGERRSAAGRQGDQFRAHLRHVAVRSGPAARGDSRRSAGIRQPLLRPLPRRAAVHGEDAQAGP